MGPVQGVFASATTLVSMVRCHTGEEYTVCSVSQQDQRRTGLAHLSSMHPGCLLPKLLQDGGFSCVVQQICIQLICQRRFAFRLCLRAIRPDKR